MASTSMDVEAPNAAADAIADAEKAASAASYALQCLAQRVFEASLSRGALAPSERSAILEEVERLKLGPYYDVVCASLGWPVDDALRQRLRVENDAELAKLDAVIADAKVQHGDVEVATAATKKAAYLAAIGDKEGAMKAYGEVSEKALSTGQRADAAAACVRMGFFHGDKRLAAERLAVAQALNEKGGDWDRRNRLKVYAGTLAVCNRDFAKAAELLLDSVATFTATELLSYEEFIFYAVLVALKTLERPRLKKSVIDAPEVVAVLVDSPLVSALLHAFYECRYADFLRSLVALYPRLARDRFFAPHAAWYLREMTLAAYAQFLEAYKCVTLRGMAEVFGVSTTFLDAELAGHIASGRVSAKIDAVAGTIVSTRPDAKNAQYLASIKQGDVLLNKVQQLSRVIAT